MVLWEGEHKTYPHCVDRLIDLDLAVAAFGSLLDRVAARVLP